MTYDWSPARIRPYVDPPPVEPWREGPWAEVTIQVELSIIRILAWPERLTKILRDEAAYLDELTSRIHTEGPQEPMLIVIDDYGRAGLQEGHHRLLTAERQGRTHWPVRFERRSGKLRYGADLSSTLLLMLRGVRS